MQYDKALNDAEISLSMCSSWTKGYFRKGKALAGLKRYAEAVIALKEVLKLDNTCADAAQELMRVQIIQLMEMGFTREQSTNALIIHGTVHKALEALYNIHGNHLVIKENPVVAGNGHAVEEEWVVSGRKVHCAAKSVPRPEIPQITQLKPVFQPSATQANIQPGARFGVTNDFAVGVAGLEIEGTKLIIRYPDNSYKSQGRANVPSAVKKIAAAQPAKPVVVSVLLQNGNEDSDAILVKSFELAVIGNQLANSGRFELAVSYFTDAIKFNPKEYRLFGNRSFCYERLMQYDKALNDAEISLSMCSSWTKGYFRKGKALAGLKRYAEAVIALKEVLKLDNTCADAAQELMRVQIIQLMEMGFTREQSTNALIIHGTVHKALEALYNIHGNHLVIKENPVVAGNGHAVEEEWVVSGRKVHCAAKSVPRPEIPQITQLKPVFQPSATQANIQPGAGPINSVKMLYDRHCAFVNYSNKEAAERAIQTLQGLEIEGTKLIIRYPDNSSKSQGRANVPSAVKKIAAAQPAKPVVVLPGPQPSRPSPLLRRGRLSGGGSLFYPDRSLFRSLGFSPLL
ncbi:UNVERIFIED_CONTAM: hypothetical protein FKN15_007035 [Acipenser sinensis]